MAEASSSLRKGALSDFSDALHVSEQTQSSPHYQFTSSAASKSQKSYCKLFAESKALQGAFRWAAPELIASTALAALQHPPIRVSFQPQKQSLQFRGHQPVSWHTPHQSPGFNPDLIVKPSTKICSSVANIDTTVPWEGCMDLTTPRFAVVSLQIYCNDTASLIEHVFCSAFLPNIYTAH